LAPPGAELSARGLLLSLCGQDNNCGVTDRNNCHSFVISSVVHFTGFDNELRKVQSSRCHYPGMSDNYAVVAGSLKTKLTFRMPRTGDI
jgi:hypothetical protein